MTYIVHAEFEPKKSIGDLVWKKEGKWLDDIGYVLRETYLLYCSTPLNTVYAEPELEESVSELMTGHEVHGRSDLVWKIHSRKSSKSFNNDICLSFHLLFLRFHSTKRGLRLASTGRVRV
jgi:hypothetical protein